MRVELGVAAQKTIEGCRQKVVCMQVVSLETVHGEGRKEILVTSGRLGLADRSPNPDHTRRVLGCKMWAEIEATDDRAVNWI